MARLALRRWRFRGAPLGASTVCVVADPSRLVAERDRTNNDTYADIVTSALPDLVAMPGSVEVEVASGPAFILSARVTNVGAAHSLAVGVEFFRGDVVSCSVQASDGRRGAGRRRRTSSGGCSWFSRRRAVECGGCRCRRISWPRFAATLVDSCRLPLSLPAVSIESFADCQGSTHSTRIFCATRSRHVGSKRAGHSLLCRSSSAMLRS